MALFPSGNRKILVQLESDEFNLYIIGEDPREKIKALKSNLNQPATIKVIGIDNTDAILKTFTSYDELAVNPGNTMMPCFLKMENISWF